MLQMSWGTFAVAGVAAISGPWRIPKLNRYRLQDVDAETFLPYLGKSLVFQRPPEDCSLSPTTAKLKLAKVVPHENISRIESRNPTKYGKRRRESFSLLFEQKGGKPLGPGLHRLAHTDFEDFQLFLSQVGVPGPDGTIYLEAIFG
jgi:hypothetical protein